MREWSDGIGMRWRDEGGEAELIDGAYQLPTASFLDSAGFQGPAAPETSSFFSFIHWT